MPSSEHSEQSPVAGSAGSGKLLVVAASQPEQDNDAGAAVQASLVTGPRLKLFAVFINILVVGELFVAMYFAAQNPDRLTPIFFKIFFSLLLPTLLGAFLGKRLIARTER